MIAALAHDPSAPAAPWAEHASESDPAQTSRGVLFYYFATCFLVGMLNQFSVRLVGLMPVGELLLMAGLIQAVVWAAFTHRLPAGVPAPRMLAALLVCQLAGLVSYMVADLVRESIPGDMIRGWSRMLFLAVDIGAFSLFFGASKRCFLALQIGMVFTFTEGLLHGPLFADYWKFGFAYPTTLLILLTAPRWLGIGGAIAGSWALGALHSALDFRSLGGICFAVGLLLGLRWMPPLFRKAILILVAVIGAAVLPSAVRHAFNDTGARATRSNVERSAMLQAAAEGFLQSPLLGQGSWFSNSKVMDQFLLIRSENARLAGVGGFADDDAEGVAIHSQLLVALAEGGLFGATFFLAYGIFLLWGIWYCLVDQPWDWVLPVRLFILLIALWSLFMSPFSGARRVEIAMAVGMLLLMWNERGQRKSVPITEPES